MGISKTERARENEMYTIIKIQSNGRTEKITTTTDPLQASDLRNKYRATLKTGSSTRYEIRS